MSASQLPRIVLGSRGRELARTQTGLVEAMLRQSWPGLEVEVQIISTRGDVRTGEPLDPRAGRKGMFTGEIERAVAAGEIDVAVHSAKDLPSDMTAGLEVGAVLARAAFCDVLITKSGGEPRGTIATGSVRRQHQLRWKLPHLDVVDLRGNVPTRLRKLVESDWHGIVLAKAGLDRLGHDAGAGSFEFEGTKLRAETLSPEDYLPAGGQGIIALQVQAGVETTKAVVRAINDATALACLEAEREFLRLLQGDCGSPVGVLATITGSEMTVRAQVFQPPRVEPRIARVEGGRSAPKRLARELWEAFDG